MLGPDSSISTLCRATCKVPPRTVSLEAGCTSPLPLAVNHPVIVVDIGRVGTITTIDEVPEASLAIDDVVAPTTVLLVVVFTSAYLVRAGVAKHHIVPAKGVDAVSVLGA